MGNREFADRLVNYADTLVAAAFIGMSATGVALGDPDIRCEFARATSWIGFSNAVLAVVMTAALMMLRRWEGVLRKDAPPSAEVDRYARILHRVRIVMIWLFVLSTIGLIAVASRDETCALVVG